jgi:crotonobetainyl-CoA:carnitine CoA-transferase CaiB-like acyl-CoA transferase
MLTDIPHPNVPDLRVPYSPLKLTKTPPSVRHHPPLLGQHNEEVLTELGYTGEQIAGLRERGVIGKLSDKRSGV